MHNIELPTRDERTRITGIREPRSVTIYVPTSKELNEPDKGRMEVKSRLREAVDELLTDGDFWRRQANSLAIFVNCSMLSTFRVRNKRIGFTSASDRFRIAPLLKAATFSDSAVVLALSRNTVRRALLSDSRVIAVRTGEVPGASPVAAILRFTMHA